MATHHDQATASEAGQQSPEYQTIRKNYIHFKDIVKQNVNRFCDLFFQEGFISTEVRDYVRNLSTITDGNKARKLIDTLADRVEHEPCIFNKLLSILKNETDFSSSNLVEKLQTSYLQAIQAEREPTSSQLIDGSNEISSQSNADLIEAQASSDSTSFLCPYCANCSVERFFSKEGCPEATNRTATAKKSLFPYLDCSKLSKDEQLVLECHLEEETRKLICLFAEIESKIACSLQIDVDVLRNYVLHYVKDSGNKEQIERLENAVIVPAIFSALHPFKSFFNYEIIAYIVDFFECEKEKQLMKTYISEFNKFCKRSVFQVPSCVYGSGQQHDNQVFAVKLTLSEHTKLQDVVLARKKMAEILEIDVVKLHLSSITTGCVCLHFLISDLIMKRIFPLSKLKIASLCKHNIMIEKTAESKAMNYFPHWKDLPPKGYPFERNLLTSINDPSFHQAGSIAGIRDIQEIQSNGRDLLNEACYIPALWKLENCLIICKQNNHDHNIAATCATDCIMICLRIHADTKEDSKQSKLLKLCDGYCEICFTVAQHDVHLLAKAHYWKAEMFKIQKRTKEALYHFKESYQLSTTSQSSALTQIILLRGDTVKILLKKFNFHQNLVSLLQNLLQSKDISIAHLETLIRFSNQVNEKKFTDAIQHIPKNVGEKLLRLCQDKEILLQEALNLLSYSEEEIASFIKDTEEDDQFCCNLLNSEKLQNCCQVMSKLKVESRTKIICKHLKSKQIDVQNQVMLLLESGKINPEKIDLSSVSKNLLLSKSLLSALIENDVNPHGVSRSVTPIQQLVKSFPKQNVAKNNALCLEFISSIQLLIEAGADVEDLNAYHTECTTPLHVATEMALITGKMDILKTVCNNWHKDLSATDEKKRTVLHLVAMRSSKFKDTSFVLKLWEYLVMDCNVDVLLYDENGKDASFYLPRHIIRQLCKTGIPYCQPELPEVPAKLKHTTGTDCRQTTASIVVQETSVSHELNTTCKPLVQISNSNTTCKPLVQSSSSHESEGDDQAQTGASHKPNAPFSKAMKPKTQHVSHREEDIYTVEKVEGSFDQLLSGTYSPSKLKTAIESLSLEKAGRISNPKENEKHHLSIIQDFSETLWEVEVSELFCKQLNSELVPKSSVFKTIKRLADGYFHIDSKQKLEVKSSEKPVFEACVNDSVHLLYSLLYRFSERATELVRNKLGKEMHVYKETVVVLKLVKNEAKHASVDTIEDHSKGNTTDDRGKCLFPHCSLRYDSNEITSAELEDIKMVLKTSKNPQGGKKSDHVHSKMYSLTAPLALKLLEGGNKRGDYPLKVTDDEFDIIEKSIKQPVVVLGRSGTGKTTVCLCRIWKTFSKYWKVFDVENPGIPKTQQYLRFEHLKEATEGIRPEETINETKASDLNAATPSDNLSKHEACFHDEEDGCEHIHQVFITKSGKLCEQMRKRFCEFLVQYNYTEAHKEFNNMKAQPQSLSDIDELSFPLFLTARQFFLMLDKSLGDGKQFFKDDETANSSEQQPSSKLETLHEERKKEEEHEGQQQSQRTEVTASYFEKHIWPKLEHFIRDKIDPFLIWMEIESYIKGSQQALESEGGILSLEDYVDFSTKRAPNFPMNRKDVYSVFFEYNRHLKYKNIKKILFDNSDFIYKLYKRLLNTSPVQKFSIHFIYIDEVQDFTQAELSVIAQCCKYPNGFFFAGDTAQTIMKGIAFRFEDLKSIFYNKDNLKLNQDMLTVNHRSHRGITNIASTVIDLLKHFFPSSFDWVHIPRDDSVLNGPKPLFLCDINLENCFSNVEIGFDPVHTVQFGADLVVIVRDNESKLNLPSLLSDVIVLTVHECKGLEFNCVILYNFFADFMKENKESKSVKKIWRASATYMEEKVKENPELQVNKPCVKIRPLKFDERLHKTLCAELKYLYTVITRAKNHLWICETSSQDSLPMLDYFYRRDVVNTSINESDFYTNEQLEEEWTAETAWKERGDELCERELWREAVKCYKHANEPVLRTKAYIKCLQKDIAEAKEKRTRNLKERAAAASYLELYELEHDDQHLKSAAFHLHGAGMYLKSAKLWEWQHEFEKALEIYDTPLKDVENYIRLSEAIEHYSRAIIFAYGAGKKYFEFGRQLTIRFVEEEKLQLPELGRIAEKITTKLVSMVKVSLLCIIDEVHELLKFVPKVEANTIKRKGKYKEAFVVLSAQKKLEDAFRLARAQNLFKEGIQLANATNTAHHMVKFQLQQGAQRILDTRLIEEKQLSIALESENEMLVAKAKLFQAIDHTRKKHDAALCQEAFDIYEKAHNKIGELECFHVLRKTITELPSLICRTVTMVQKANSVNETLLKFSENETMIDQMELFYGLELDPASKIKYFVPKTYYLWFARHGKCKSLRCDLDGMVELDQVSAIKMVISHIQDYVSDWQKGAESALLTKFKESFPFHTELKRHSYIRPESRFLSEKKCNISEYMKLCELEFQLYEVYKSVGDPTTVLVQLLSPFSQLIISLSKQELKNIVLSTNLYTRLSNEVKNAIKAFNEPNCDRWLKAWYILSLLHTNDTQESPQVLLEHYQREQVAHCGWNKHYFSSWLESCEQLKGGTRALNAIEISTDNFIQYVVDRSSVDNMFISMESLITVLSIHTALLLTMLSCSYARHNQQDKSILIPQTLVKFVHNFNLINSNGKPSTDKACFETAKAMEVNTLQDKIFNLLHKFLSILIGRHKANFNPLKIALEHSEPKSPDIFHCLVLTLTIFINLALICDTSTWSYFQETYEEIFGTNKMPKPVSYFQETYEEIFETNKMPKRKSIQQCETIQDLVQDVLCELLNIMSLKLVQVQEEKQLLQFIECRVTGIQKIPLKLEKSTNNKDPIWNFLRKKITQLKSSHTSNYTSEWLRVAEIKLQAEFKRNFPFHDQLKVHKCLQPQPLRSNNYNMDHYVKVCEFQHFLYAAHEDIGDPTAVLVYLFSPFSQLTICFSDLDFKKVAWSTCLSTALKCRVENSLKTVNEPNCDRWLEAWYILSFLQTNSENLKALLESHQQEDVMHHNKNAEYKHYFSVWLESCRLLKGGTMALKAIQITTDNFIQHAVDCSSGSDMFISLENLVAVLSTHTTVLLMLLSHSYARQNQQEKMIPVPETFVWFMRTFQLINSCGGSTVNVQKAAYETARAMEIGTLQAEIHSLLHRFLSLLIGKFKSTFNPWESVIKNSPQKSPDTFHCLLLTLTILINLILMYDSSSYSVFQETYKEMLKCLTSSKSLGLPHKIYENIKNSKTVQDLVKNVLCKLLNDTVDMKMLQLKIISEEGQEQIKFVECQSDEIPDIPLRCPNACEVGFQTSQKTKKKDFASTFIDAEVLHEEPCWDNVQGEENSFNIQTKPSSPT